MAIRVVFGGRKEGTNLDPQKFFIGVIDFFSVLMPGAILSYLARPWIAAHILNNMFFNWTGTEGWTVLLFCSYLLGHFIFLVGSSLDSQVYDRIRQAAYLGQVRRLADGRHLSHPALRWLSETGFFFGKAADKTVIQIQRIKANSLLPIKDFDAINGFQWSKAVLSVEHPQGLVAVERLEADSKFFRSFVVVSILLFCHYLLQQRFELVAVYFVMGYLGLLRYVDQRYKAAQKSYWLVMAHGTLGDKPNAKVEPLPRNDGLTHACGVVFRKKGNEVQYLFVETPDAPPTLMLHEGCIEAGEGPRQTAVRRLKEETSHWARTVGFLQDIHTGQNSTFQVTRFYLLELDEERDRRIRSPENCEESWLNFNEAKQDARLEGIHELLQAAEEKRQRFEELRRATP